MSDKFIKELDKLIHLQNEILQTEISNPYMHGLANGLLTAKSVFTGKQEPLFEKFGNLYKQSLTIKEQ